jgi:uncharacterized membrane protein
MAWIVPEEKVMPNIGVFHPQIVHFVIVLLFVGVGLRCLSLLFRGPFFTTAATLCLFFGTLAAVLAVTSGTQAHGPVERIPGARAQVIEHEEHAEAARNIFLGVVAIEIVALVVGRERRRPRLTRWIHAASAVVGLAGAWVLFGAAERGGDLVYSYAGGPGLRSGDPKDVERLLVAGLYNESVQDRKAGRAADAATLIDELARRMPSDPEVKLLRAESMILDRKNYAAAMVALDSVTIEPSNTRLRARAATIKANAYIGLGKPDSARAVLTATLAAMPQNRGLKAKLDSLK